MARFFIGLLERRARAEAWHPALGNGDGGTGLRIACLAGFPVRRLERPEADERNAVAFLQSLRDGLDDRIDRDCRSGLRRARVLRELHHEFTLVHATSSSPLSS